MATTVTKTCDRCGGALTLDDGVDNTPLAILYREVSNGKHFHYTSESFDVCLRCHRVIHDVIHGKALVTKC